MEVNYKQRKPKNQKSNYHRWTPTEVPEVPIITAPSGDYRRHISETSHSHEGGGAKSVEKNNSKKHIAVGGAGARPEVLDHSTEHHPSRETESSSYVKPNKYGACIGPYYCTSVRENRLCMNCGDAAKAAQVRDGIIDENAGRGWIHGICGFGWICRKNTKYRQKPCTLHHPKPSNYCEVSTESYERSSPSVASIVRATVESARTRAIRPLSVAPSSAEARVSRVTPEIATTFASTVTNVISARAASIINVPTIARPLEVSARSEEIELDSRVHLMVSNLLDDPPVGTAAPPGLSRSSPESTVAGILSTSPIVSHQTFRAREAKLLFDTTLREAMRINDMSDNMSYDAMLIGIRTAMYHIQQRVNSI